jgi:hypothetical protein
MPATRRRRSRLVEIHRLVPKVAHSCVIRGMGRRPNGEPLFGRGANVLQTMLLVSCGLVVRLLVNNL